eukprot:scaffold9758_cov167-Amphora_coffeaeformis.AAC.2
MRTTVSFLFFLLCSVLSSYNGNFVHGKHHHHIRQLKHGMSSKGSSSSVDVPKLLRKLGMRPVAGVLRVTVKKPNTDVHSVIDEPDVWKSPTSDTYFVLGKAEIEDDERKLREGVSMDKVLEKLEMEIIPGIVEVHFFKDDGKVILFENPEVRANPSKDVHMIIGAGTSKP